MAHLSVILLAMALGVLRKGRLATYYIPLPFHSICAEQDPLV